MSILLAVVAFSLWQGEKHYVWTDFTNTTERAVLVKPVGDGASLRYLALLNGINKTEKLLRQKRNVK